MDINRFLQNLRYRHKQIIKVPKYKLAYMDFFHETFLFSHQSKNIYRQSVSTLPKFRYQRSKYCFSIIKQYTVVRGGHRTPATSTNRDICCNSQQLQVYSYGYKKVPSYIFQGSNTHPPVNIVSFKVPLNKSSPEFYLKFYLRASAVSIMLQNL